MKYLLIGAIIINLVVSIYAQENSGANNIAVGKKAIQSSIYGGLDAPKAVDGNTDGSYSNQSITHTMDDLNPWWQVDLGSIYDISEIKIYNRTDACSDRLSNYWVFVSKTPMMTNNLDVLRKDSSIFKLKLTNFPNPTISIPVNAKGKYIQIQIEGKQYLSLAEVEIFSKQTTSTPPPTTFGIPDLNYGMLLHLKLDGDTRDSSGYNHHGTPFNVQFTTDQNGTTNSACYFRGTSDSKIEIPGRDFNAPMFTIAVWVNGDSISSLSNYPRIFDKYDWEDKTGYGLNIMNSANKRVFYLEYWDQNKTLVQLWSKESLKPGWQHVAVTFDGQTACIYYNGKLSAKKTHASKGIDFNQKNVTIGANYNDDSYPFKGAFNDLMFWGRALGDDEISSIYSGVSTSSPTTTDQGFSLPQNIDSLFNYTLNRKIQRLEKVSGVLNWIVCDYPWVTIQETAKQKFYYYSFTVSAGSKAVFDIDNAYNTQKTSGNVDTKIVLWKADGTPLGGNKNLSDFSWFFGTDIGSENDANGKDSYFEWTFKESGTYILGVAVNDSKELSSHGFDTTAPGLGNGVTFELTIAIQNKNNHDIPPTFQGGN